MFSQATKSKINNRTAPPVYEVKYDTPLLDSEVSGEKYAQIIAHITDDFTKIPILDEPEEKNGSDWDFIINEVLEVGRHTAVLPGM